MPQDATPMPSADRPRPGDAVESRTASDVDRGAAFRRAGRHTVVVKALRLLMPVSAIALFASYGIFMQRSISIGWADKKVEIDKIELSSQALVAHNPRYTGFDKQGGNFEVRAITAEQDLKVRGLVRLNGIVGHITDASRMRTDIKATRGRLDTGTNVLEMFERIDVASQNGMTAELTSATVYTKENRIVSQDPVIVRMPTGTVRGNAMTIEQKTKQILFTGGVVANLQPQPKVAKQPSSDPALRGTNTAGTLGPGNSPIDITASRLSIDDHAKTAVFAGNVIAKQTDSKLETAELEIAYYGQPAAAASAPPTGQPATKSEAATAGRVRRLVAKSDLVLTRGQERATGSAGEFDAINDRAVLMGPVVINAGPERGATADRAELDNKNDMILLLGSVVVIQQKNVLKGRRLQADRKKGTMQLSSPAQPGQAKGQISAHLQQTEAEGAARKPAAAAPKAQTQNQNPLGSNLQADPNKPVDIDADTLDVDDRAKRAIFRGKVRAVQGEYTIVTEELVATYSGEAGMALGTPAAASASGQPKGSAQLQKVIAPRQVEIIAKDGQRARGNSAVFDIKTNVATLTGDVRLVQGTTITTGPCAHLDMNTGSMRIIHACGFSSGPTTAAPAAPPTGGRAQVLLFPGQLKEDRQQDKAKAKSSGSNSGGPAATTTAKQAQSPAAAPAAQAAPPAPAPLPKRPAASRDEPSNPFGFGN